jgi:hypothetical protein
MLDLATAIETEIEKQIFALLYCSYLCPYEDNQISWHIYYSTEFVQKLAGCQLHNFSRELVNIFYQ